MSKRTASVFARQPMKARALTGVRVATLVLVALTIGILADADPAWSSDPTQEDHACDLSYAAPELSAAWDRVEQIDQRKCPQGTELRPLTPDERDEAFICWRAIVWEQVGPLTKDRDALSAFIEKWRDERHRRVFAKFDSGAIDRDELRELIRDLWNEDWADYLAKEVGSLGSIGCSKRRLI